MKLAKRLTSCLMVAGWIGAASLMPHASFAKSKMADSKMGAMAKTPKTGKSSQMTGIVVSMTATSLTLKPTRKAKGALKTVQIPAGTRIMMGKNKMMLSDLKAGEKVTVRMNAAGEVTSIMDKGMPASKTKMSGTEKKM